MGDLSCDSDGNCYDSTSGVFSTPANPINLQDYATPGDSVAAYGGPASYPPVSPLAQLPGTTVPAGSSWFQTLLNDATQLAAPLIRSSVQQDPRFITSPTGQSVLYNPNTGQVGGGSALSLGASTLSPTVLLGGLAVLALLAFSGKKSA
jgi:hypothetical protein